MALKNDWQNGDYFSADDQNDVANAVNAASARSSTTSASTSLALDFSYDIWIFNGTSNADWSLPDPVGNEGKRLTVMCDSSSAIVQITRTNAIVTFDGDSNGYTTVSSISTSLQTSITFEARNGLWFVVDASPGSRAGMVTPDSGATLTNKRIKPRIYPFVGSPSIALADRSHQQVLGNTTVSAPSGSPSDGEQYGFRIKDNGTARALTWNAIYRPIGVTLPTTTVAGKTLYVTTIYNAADNKWDVIDVKQEA